MLMAQVTKSSVEKKMQEALEHLRKELNNIRTGRANPHLLDNVAVNVYGAEMRIRDLASVTAPEARQLLITPYDNNNTGNISKAIEKANLNLQPVVDGNIIRITIPPMDEAQRKEKVKLAKKKGEEGKVSIRNVRRDSNDTIRKQKNEGDLSEDIMKRTEKDIQELTDQFCKKIDDLIHEKEKDILTI